MMRAYITILFLTALILFPLWATDASAQLPNAPSGTCSTDPQYDIPIPSGGGGLLSSLVIYVQQSLTMASSIMYNGITGSGGFITYIRGALTLYIILYGIFFTIGMAKITLYDFSLRMVKLATIATLTSPSGWGFFQGTIVYFFNAGTDDIINAVTQLAIGDPNLGVSGPPFAVLDGAITLATCARMALTLLALFGTGPYGVIFGFFIIFSIGSFMKALVNALWVYLMALTAKTLLFGVGPIFLSFALFSRTRHFFDGWLNQIINASLQPIFLFSFFGFFSLLMQACLINILSIPVCWTEWKEALRGSPFTEHFWRFAWIDSSRRFQPYSGIWDFNSGMPISLIPVLTFLILAELAGRFNGIAIQTAKVLASASTDFRMGHESIRGWFSNPFGGSGSNLYTPRTRGFAESEGFGGGGGGAGDTLASAAGIRRGGTGLGGPGSRAGGDSPTGIPGRENRLELAAHQAGAGLQGSRGTMS